MSSSAISQSGSALHGAPSGSEPSGPDERWGEDWCEDFREDDGEDDEFEFECGAFINGRFDYSACQLAGTEDCDWDCPYSAGVRGLK